MACVISSARNSPTTVARNVWDPLFKSIAFCAANHAVQQKIDDANCAFPTLQCGRVRPHTNYPKTQSHPHAQANSSNFI